MGRMRVVMDGGWLDNIKEKLNVIALKLRLRPAVVIIDPAHGGNDAGAVCMQYAEKDMVMTVAEAMRNELEKYNGVEVHMSRVLDLNVPYSERCAQAEMVNADFVVSLHFGTSYEHDRRGARCLIPRSGWCRNRSYGFANVELEMLRKLGIEAGGIDIVHGYEIVGMMADQGVPCVAVVHCHIDNEGDRKFCRNDEMLKNLGRMDAAAMARFLKLKSKELGTDYRNHENKEIDILQGVSLSNRNKQPTE